MEPVAGIVSVTLKISRHARQRAARLCVISGCGSAAAESACRRSGAFGSCPACCQTNARPVETALAGRKQEERARWSLGRPTLFCKWLGVFLFVLKLDGAVDFEHNTGLLEVGLEEGWRRLLGARLIGIARQPFSALNVHISGCAEDGHSRHLAISEGRYERRRTEQRRRLLLGLDLRHDQPPAGARRSESPPQRSSARRHQASARLPAR